MTAILAGSTLSRGAKGDKVFALQVALRSAGAELKPDSDFGAITLAAVKAFQAAHGLKPDGEVGPLTAAALDGVKPLAMPDPLPSSLAIAPHLSVMRAITGTKEVLGAKNNPTILSWATEIVALYPDLKAGVGWYRTDATAWCGLGMAYCVAKAGFKPPAEPLWALNWSGAWPDGVKLKTPVLGAIGVMSRNGGGHVTMYEGEDSAGWFGRGCNQSDQVNVAKFPHSRAVTWMWPKGLSMPAGGRVKTNFASAVASTREA